MFNTPIHPFLSPHSANYAQELLNFRKEIFRQAQQAGEEKIKSCIEAAELHQLSPSERKYHIEILSNDVFEGKIVEILDMNLKINFHRFSTAISKTNDLKKRDQESRYYVEALHRIIQELYILRDIGNSQAISLLNEIFITEKYMIPSQSQIGSPINARIINSNSNSKIDKYHKIYLKDNDKKESSLESEQFIDIRSNISNQSKVSDNPDGLTPPVIEPDILKRLGELFNKQFPALPKPSKDKDVEIPTRMKKEKETNYVESLEEKIRNQCPDPQYDNSNVKTAIKPTNPVSNPPVRNAPSTLSSPKKNPSDSQNRKKKLKKERNSNDGYFASTSKPVENKSKLSETSPLKQLYLSEITPENSRELLTLALNAQNVAKEEDLGFISYSLFKIYKIIGDIEKASDYLVKAALRYGFLDAIKELIRQKELGRKEEEILSLFEQIEEDRLDDDMLQQYAQRLGKQPSPNYEKIAFLLHLCKDKKKIMSEYTETLKKLATQNLAKSLEYCNKILNLDRNNKNIIALKLYLEYRELLSDIPENKFFEFLYSTVIKEIEDQLLYSLFNKDQTEKPNNANPDETDVSNDANNNDATPSIEEKQVRDKFLNLISKLEVFLDKAFKNSLFINNLDETTRLNLEHASALFNFYNNEIVYENKYSQFEYLMFLKNLDNELFDDEIYKSHTEVVETLDLRKNNSIMEILEKSIPLYKKCSEGELSHFVISFFCLIPHSYEILRPHLTDSLRNTIDNFLWHHTINDSTENKISPILKFNILQALKQLNLKPVNEILYHKSIVILSLLSSFKENKKRDLAWENRITDHTNDIKNVLEDNTISLEWRTTLENTFHTLLLYDAICKIESDENNQEQEKLYEIIEEHSQFLSDRNIEPNLLSEAYTLLAIVYENRRLEGTYDQDQVLKKLNVFKTKVLDLIISVSPEIAKEHIESKYIKDKIINWAREKLELLIRDNNPDPEKTQMKKYMNLIKKINNL